jgi:hypothetical protein
VSEAAPEICPSTEWISFPSAALCFPQYQNNYNCGFQAICPLLDLRTKSIVVAMPPRALSNIAHEHDLLHVMKMNLSIIVFFRDNLSLIVFHDNLFLVSSMTQSDLFVLSGVFSDTIRLFCLVSSVTICLVSSVTQSVCSV